MTEHFIEDALKQSDFVAFQTRNFDTAKITFVVILQLYIQGEVEVLRTLGLDTCATSCFHNIKPENVLKNPSGDPFREAFNIY